MRKLFVLVLAFFMLQNYAFAVCPSCSKSNCNHTHANYHHNHSSNSSDNVYLVNTEHRITEQKFPNCDEHYVVTETITNYYSNGTRNVYINSTIYNSDGTVLKSDCQNVEHVVYQNEHYFLIKKDGYFQIINDDGEITSQRRYSHMKEIEPNRILVRFDKKYGIIDLYENTIIPIKYQEFKQVNNKLFITKLNHYYGVLDIENNIHLKNECEKIKQVGDLLSIKKYNKFGLMNSNGVIVADIKYDKIRRMGEYFLAKINVGYLVLDYTGKPVSKTYYNKVRLRRNNLEGYINGTWISVENL